MEFHGERVYYMPEHTQNFSGIRFLRTGLLLGELKKKRFENILSAIYNEAASAYNVVFGKQLTLQDFKEF